MNLSAALLNFLSKTTPAPARFVVKYLFFSFGGSL